MTVPNPVKSPDLSRYKDPVIEAYKRDVDRTLIRACLKMTPEQRLVSLQNSLADVVELRKAMKVATGQ